MAPQQIYSQPSPVPGSGDESGHMNHTDGKFEAVTLRGRPVDKSKTGGFRATFFIYALNIADWGATVSALINVVFYAYNNLHQDISRAANISTNYLGTSALLALLGAFLADSFLGHYYTIVIGGIIESVGWALLTFTATYSGLKPPACTATLVTTCPPAGGKYIAPFFAGLYCTALGTGLIKSTLPALGAEQFDESDPVETKQSIHFFSWFFCCQLVGGFIGFTLSVYMFNYVGADWGFGWLLIFYVVSLLLFIAGTPIYRHKAVGGSFITRLLQAIVAAIRKRKLHLPDDASQLHDEPISGCWINRSNKLRFLDKASIIEKDGKISNKWKLVGTTQVEEAKRVVRLLPVWLSTCGVPLIFAQVVTFTATQGSTLNRRVGTHTLPAATLGVALPILSIIMVPVYDRVLMPIFSKITKRSYGITPLKRIGIAVLSGILAMICAALVERKRLGYVRRLGYTQVPAFVLPMSMWWLIPQYFFSGATELFLFVSLYEFYYHEVSDATRSIGTSFLFTALALGYFMSSVIVDTTNSVTKHHKDGAWLQGRLNNGGLENYFWLLAILLSINGLLYLVATHFYTYNYSLFRKNDESSKTLDTEAEHRQRD